MPKTKWNLNTIYISERLQESLRPISRSASSQMSRSEGSVKQYINQIYSKLHIEGDTRTKRSQLVELFLPNP